MIFRPFERLLFALYLRQMCGYVPVLSCAGLGHSVALGRVGTMP